MKLLNLSTDTIGRPPKPMLRGKIYYLRQRIGGKDCWRSLNTTDKREAQYLALEFWRQRQSDRIKAIIPAPPMPISQIWDNYTRNDRFIELSDSTKASKSRTWKSFANWCMEHRITYPEQLPHDLATKYLSGDNRKNKTFNNVLNDLRAAFQYGGATRNVFDDIERLPTHRGSIEKRSEQFRAFSDEEISKILSAIKESRMKHKEEWWLAAFIAANTGLRYKDIALLRWEYIHADELGQYIETTPHKTDRKTGGKVVYIRLVPDLALQLNAQRSIRESDFILPELAAAYKRDQVHATQPFSDFLAAQKIEKASFHCFRVTVVTKAAKAGVNLEEFGGVIGHSTENQTQAYNRAALNIDMIKVVSARLE